MTTPIKTKKSVPADILQVHDFLEDFREDLSDAMAREVEEWFNELLDVVAAWKDDEGYEPDWQGLRDWLNHICADDGMPPLFPKSRAIAEKRTITYSHPDQLAGYEPGKGHAHDYIPAWMQIPLLYANEDNPNPVAVIKLFTPDASWTWFLMEYDGGDLLFGLVVGQETEFGYISLAELQRVTGPLGLRIERDLWFQPTPVRELAEYQAKWGSGGPYRGKPGRSVCDGPDEVPPWQISRLAYQQSKAIQVAGGVPVLNAADGEEHRRQVLAALARGDAVPAFVLADYPDLVASEEQATGDQLHTLCPNSAEIMPKVTGENTQFEVPNGSLALLYPNALTTDLLWTGDTRSFDQAGYEHMLQAFAYLHDVSAYVQSHLGYQVLSVSKAYDATTQVLVADRDVEESYHEATLNAWGDIAFSLTTTIPQDALVSIIQGCYAGPDLPADWEIEGQHLDAEIRTLLHQAYEQERVEGSVYQTEFHQRLQKLAKERSLFRHLKTLKLWSLERFCQSAGLNVRQRQSWKYVLPEKRRLAASLVGNISALLSELESNPADKRQNVLLSELADLDQLPAGWVNAEKGGKPLVEEIISDPEPTPADQAEFQQWSLELLTGRLQPRSVFHKALQRITLPGALRLALNQIQADTERRGLIEQRLNQLIHSA